MTQASVRQIDRVVQQYGDAVGYVAGCDIVTLSDAQAQQLLTLLAAPNGGIALNADGSFTSLPPAPPFTDPKMDQAISICKTYYGSTAPTASDTVTALKALMYVVRGNL